MTLVTSMNLMKESEKNLNKKEVGNEKRREI